MKKSGFAIASCFMFAMACASACVAWSNVGNLPKGPRNHMDFAPNLARIFVDGGIGLAIIFGMAGLLLGVFGIRRSERLRFVAWIGIVLNGLCLIGVVVWVRLMMLAAR